MSRLLYFSFLLSSPGVTIILSIPNDDGTVFLKNNNVTCSQNPEEDMTAIEIIRNSGYPEAEEHLVESRDGYILGLHRIPGPEGSRAVLLHHGLADSSFAWLTLGKKKALAYELANSGYDVWMGNARGYVYSRRHSSLSPDDSAFWNFSFHEMGVYDLPAEIEYIASLKNDSLVYIGHSMGTTIFFVMASERPEILSQVELMIGLGPAVYFNHIRGLTRMMYPFLESLQMHTDGHVELPFLPAFNYYVSKCFCNRSPYREICRDLVFSITGFNPDKFDMSLLPIIGTHSPAGTSLKVVFHYGQAYNTKKFLKYDYGTTKNIEVYNSSIPREYDLSKVTVPVAFLYGLNDFVTPPEDVVRLWREMPKKIGLFQMEDPKFTHTDFVWASHAPKLVNSKIILLLNKHDNLHSPTD